jgi:hypothetical protein
MARSEIDGGQVAVRERITLVRLAAAVVVLLGLACGPCSLLSRQSPTPPHPISVSPEAASQLRARIQQALNGQPGQQFILRMSDAEITSLLSTELAQVDEAPVADPVVWFTKGKIYATGSLVNVVPVSARFYMAAIPHIEDGKVVIDIEEFSAGALPIPRALLEKISQSMNETVDELQLSLEVTALEILEGEAIVQGIRQ